MSVVSPVAAPHSMAPIAAACPLSPSMPLVGALSLTGGSPAAVTAAATAAALALPDALLVPQLDASLRSARRQLTPPIDAAPYTPPPLTLRREGEVVALQLGDSAGGAAAAAVAHEPQTSSPPLPPLLPFLGSPPLAAVRGSSPEAALLPLPFSLLSYSATSAAVGPTLTAAAAAAAAVGTEAEEEEPDVRLMDVADSQELRLEDFDELPPLTPHVAPIGALLVRSQSSLEAAAASSFDDAADDAQAVPVLLPLEPCSIPLQQTQRSRRGGRGGRGRPQSHVALVLARLNAEAAHSAAMLESQPTESEGSDDDDEEAAAAPSHRRGVSFAPMLEQLCLFRSDEGTDQLQVLTAPPVDHHASDESMEEEEEENTGAAAAAGMSGHATAAADSFASASAVAAAAFSSGATAMPIASPLSIPSPTSPPPVPLLSPSAAGSSAQPPQLRSILKRKRADEDPPPVQQQPMHAPFDISSNCAGGAMPLLRHARFGSGSGGGGSNGVQLGANVRIATDPPSPRSKRQRRGQQFVMQAVAQQQAAFTSSARRVWPVPPLGAIPAAVATPMQQGECDMPLSLRQLIYPGSVFAAALAASAAADAAAVPPVPPFTVDAAFAVAECETTMPSAAAAVPFAAGAGMAAALAPLIPAQPGPLLLSSAPSLSPMGSPPSPLGSPHADLEQARQQQRRETAAWPDLWAGQPHAHA